MKQKRYVTELWNYDNEYYESIYETNRLQEIDAVIREAVQGIKNYLRSRKSFLQSFLQ